MTLAHAYFSISFWFCLDIHSFLCQQLVESFGGVVGFLKDFVFIMIGSQHF